MCHKLSLLTLFTALFLAAGGAFAPAQQQELIGAGATFPEPLYAKMFDVYLNQSGVRINYQGIGSGGGIQQLLQKTVDFAGSDAYVKDAQMASFGGSVLHVPTCLGAVVVTYNLPGSPFLNLTPDVIADIFLGRITTWNDGRIAALNPSIKLPAATISVVHRSDGSGTSFVFTDYLSKVSPEWKLRVGSGTAVKWPCGIGGKGNPGVAQLVKQTAGGVGYVELAYAEKNKMPYALIRNRGGVFVKPSIASVTAAAVTEIPADTRATITDTLAKDGYPISAFTWILVYPEQNYGGRPMAKVKAMVKLLWWMTHEGQMYCKDLLYAPLPKAVVAKAEAIIRSIRFDGKPLMK
ncbi:MAG: phosphate ABC transporter substrate-binding protein PstS [Acidobacteria bacterium]|nr:phosphate ABC transporter substrate-binding protein PstS [Acidobacteriota bacterium]